MKIYIAAAIFMAFIIISGCKSGPKNDSVDSKDKADSDMQPTSVSIPPGKTEARNIAHDSVESLNVSSKGGYTNEELNGLVEEKKETPAAVESGHFYDYYLKKNKDANKATHVVMGFNAAPMVEVIPVFAQVLDFDFVMDPRVKGVITMSVDTNLSQTELWGIFEQILWQTGSYCSMDSGVLHILPFTDMAKEKFLAQGANPKANVTVKLFNLKNMKSKDLIERLKPFLTDGAVLIDVNEQNGVFVLESSDNMEKIEAIVHMLDVKGKFRWPKAVFKCTNIPAPKIVEELNSILPVLGFPVAQSKNDSSSNTSGPNSTSNTTAAGQPDDNSGAIFLRGMQRLQLIVASAANAEALEEIKKWIEILDRSDVGEQEQVFVYNIVNGRADELVNVIATIFNAQGQTLTPSANLTISGTSGGTSTSGSNNSASGSGSGGGASPSPSPTPRTSIATAYDVTQIQSQNQQPVTGGGGGTGGMGSPGTSPSGVIGGAGNQNQNQIPVSVFEVPVTIFADAVNDRLIIRTTPRVYAMIKALLSRIDTTPAQVLLRVTIAEVALSAETTINIEAQDYFGPNTIGTDYGNMSSAATTMGKSNYGFTYFNTSKNVNAFITALATKSKTNTLANPEVLVQNHTQATVNVGWQIPVLTQNMQSSVGGNSVPTVNNSYTYKNVGVIVTITPHITKGGQISIDINQQVSNIMASPPAGAIPANSSNYSPVFKQRLFQTSLTFPDGGTIIVGGMINQNESDKVSTVPFISNIPLLSNLVGDTDYEKDRGELILIISGSIISNASTLEQMTERYKQATKLIQDAGNRSNVTNDIVFEAEDWNKITIK